MEPSRPKFFMERSRGNRCDKAEQGVGWACEDLLDFCKMQIRLSVSKLPNQVATASTLPFPCSSPNSPAATVTQ